MSAAAQMVLPDRSLEVSREKIREMVGDSFPSKQAAADFFGVAVNHFHAILSGSRGIPVWLKAETRCWLEWGPKGVTGSFFEHPYRQVSELHRMVRERWANQNDASAVLGCDRKDLQEWLYHDHRMPPWLAMELRDWAAGRIPDWKW